MTQRVRPVSRCSRRLIFMMSALCSPWLLGGCAEVPAPASQIAALPAPVPPSATIEDYIHEAAQKFNVPERWIRAVMQQESGGRTHVNGQPIVSQKGAMGLMQVMPSTWEYLRAAYGLGNDPFDPHDNIMAGTAYIREMYDQYGTPGFLAAYNAGPGRYEVTLKTHRPLPGETKHYMAVIAPQIAGVEPEGGSPTRAVMTVAALPDRTRGEPAHSVTEGDPDAKPATTVVAVLPVPPPPVKVQAKPEASAAEPVPAAAPTKPKRAAPSIGPSPVLQLASLEVSDSATPAPQPASHPHSLATAYSEPHLPNGLTYADHRTNLPQGWYVPVAYAH